MTSASGMGDANSLASITASRSTYGPGAATLRSGPLVELPTDWVAAGMLSALNGETDLGDFPGVPHPGTGTFPKRSHFRRHYLQQAKDPGTWK